MYYILMCLKSQEKFLQNKMSISILLHYLFHGGSLDVSTALAIGVISGTMIGILESNTAIDSKLRLALIS